MRFNNLFLSLGLLSLFSLSVGVIAQTPVPIPAPSKALTDVEARAEFSKQDTARIAIAIGAKERGEVAQKEIDLVGMIAWNAFASGNYDEASIWFAKRFDLKHDKYASDRAYYEIMAKQMSANIEKATQKFQKQLDTETDPVKKKNLQAMVNTMAQMRYTSQHTGLVMLETLAQDNDDTLVLLGYEQQDLAVYRSELGLLVKTQNTADEINRTKAKIASAMESIAAAQADLAQISSAEATYQTALALRESLPSDLPERRLDSTYGDLGLMYYINVGNFRKARDNYLLALTALDENAGARAQGIKSEQQAQFNDLRIGSDALSRATIYKNLGGIMQMQGDYKAARSYYDQALQVAIDLPKGGYLNFFEIARVRIRASSLSDLADLDSETGDAETAIKEDIEVIDLEKSMSSDQGIANALEGMADILYRRNAPGDLDAAKHDVEQAKQIFVSLQNPLHVASLTDFEAILADKAGQLSDAEQSAQQALTLTEKLGNLSETVSSLNNLAAIELESNRPDAAMPLLERAEALQAQVGDTLDQAYTLELQARVLEAQNHPDAALAKYKSAIALVEAVRETAASQSAFASVHSHSRVYEHIVALLIKMNRPAEAFDYLNRSKSKEVQNALPLTSLRTTNKTLQAKIDQTNGLQSELQTEEVKEQTEKSKPVAQQNPELVQSLGKTIATTRKQFYQAADELVKANPNYEDLLKVNPTTLVEAQRKIPAGVILVECEAQEDQLYTFLVTKSSLKIIQTPVKAADLWNRIKSVRDEIASPDTDVRGARLVHAVPKMPVDTTGLADNLTALYDLIIAPIEPELADETTIAFIPTKYFYYLPIQALAKRKNGVLHYLIEDKQITYLAAADVMKAMDTPDPSELGTGMVAFGDPTGANLPFAQQEVTTIAKVFPATQVFTGNQATKSAVLDPKHWNTRILHFATHGMLDAKSPDKSYILMANGATPDLSQLTIPDIYDLELDKVDLVTISACETALGDEQPGSEVLSLANAFDRARARTVIASLWSVADDSTSDLMVEFYRQLASGKSKAAALQAAQIHVLSEPKFSQPFYWAPFVLMGDWR